MKVCTKTTSEIMKSKKASCTAAPFDEIERRHGGTITLLTRLKERRTTSKHIKNLMPRRTRSLETHAYEPRTQIAVFDRLHCLIGRIKNSVTLVAALATSVAVSAGAMPANIDTNGDGLASLTELQALYPELTEEVFLEMDTDGDGFINDEEMAIAVRLGNLVAPATDV